MFKLAEINPFRRLNLIKNILKMEFGTNKFIETIVSPNAPKAIGPYSQGKIINKDAKLIYTSGSLGIDPTVCFEIPLLKLGIYISLDWKADFRGCGGANGASLKK